GVLGSIPSEKLLPLLPGPGTTFAYPCCEVFIHTAGNEEFRVLWPSVAALAEADLLLAKWLTVGCSGVLLVRGTVTNMAVEDDEGGAALRLLENLEGALDANDVVGIAHPQNIPAV